MIKLPNRYGKTVTINKTEEGNYVLNAEDCAYCSVTYQNEKANLICFVDVEGGEPIGMDSEIEGEKIAYVYYDDILKKFVFVILGDKMPYNEFYRKAKEEVKKLMKKYPSLRVGQALLDYISHEYGTELVSSVMNLDKSDCFEKDEYVDDFIAFAYRRYVSGEGKEGK